MIRRPDKKACKDAMSAAVIREGLHSLWEHEWLDGVNWTRTVRDQHIVQLSTQ